MGGLVSIKNISRVGKHIQYLERCVSYDCGECYNGVWLNRNEWLRRKANSYLINVMLLMLMLLWLEFFSSKKQYDNVSTQCYESCGCYECYQRWYNGENISLISAHVYCFECCECYDCCQCFNVVCLKSKTLFRKASIYHISSSWMLLMLRALRFGLFYITKALCKVITHCFMNLVRIMSVFLLGKIYHTVLRKYSVLSVVSIMTVLSVLLV